MARNGYATVWRWHFYAGLFTAPFLLILAITGALYLFNDELNDLIYPQLRFAPSGDAVLPAGDLVAAVREAYPRDTVTRIDMPVNPGRTAMVFVTPEQGESLRVFVDPGDGTILGDVIYAHTLVGFADVMHGSLLLGRGGDALVELAASWALVLVITGLHLWWPRGRRSRAFTFGRRTRGRKRWREIHRLVGVYTAVMIVFLIITGLPWASFWGDRVLSPVSNALGLGYPPQLRHHGGGEASAEPVKTMVDTLGNAPWALQQAPLPHVHHHHGEHGGELDTSTAAINRVHDILAGQGLPYGYRLSIPADAGDPYSAYTYPDRPQGQRTLHVDSGGHRLLVNVGFDDYGAIAKAVELGVALHMGNYFGRANQIVMLLTCVAIVALVITGVVMWWRRRPAGGLGAPDSPPIRKRYWLAITLTLLALLPLAGLSLLLVLALEKGMMARRRSVAG
ncbi:PepSY domain-containing protein [Alloalcanivorax xenomutans]|uniref:PepSY-associated TM helix domain-containing protein n=1 Tax=Alloalcanivorax xenomutans TaxID=1094342 RepID=UPI002934F0CF|nr:PepSY domain-containing protein [Alloalcanivorax xenomutans]WOD29816.1 PepSY domain-containing protein [Alloalcanivorax xenomutans]